MLSAEPTQFKLDDEGKIFFQADPTNPLPGEEMGVISKGDNILRPAVKALDERNQKGLEEAVAKHVELVLEVLVGLRDTAGLSAPVVGICERLYDAMGILPREALQDLIDQLDTDMRAELRGKKVRLGPVLAFMPALNKPAGVRLRALLWALDKGMELPACIPNDGIVSLKVEDGADKDFYLAIGYPLYASRAVRIDMLDRVINAVYDGADKGQFRAEHKMAEWLGSSIEDLYAVLSAMGHVKVSDPADDLKEGEEAPKSEGEGKSSVAAAGEGEKPSAGENPPAAVEEGEKPPVGDKPELATFRLKKGKASSSAEGKSPKAKAKASDKKAKGRPKKGERKKSEPRVMSATVEANPEDNPFAVLGQLKK